MRMVRRAADAAAGRLRQLRALLQKRRVERELADELAHHVALETEQNIGRGMAPAEARRAALVAFGGVERYAEQVREVRWTRWVEDVAHDVRYAVRTLVRARTFSVTVVLTLALGIGANAALYGVIDGLVFRMPTGVPQSDGLVWVQNDGRIWGFAHADLRDLRSGATDVIDVAGYQRAGVALRARGEPVRVYAQLVTANYFDVLGMRPAQGRWFVADEDEVPARDAVAVISHDLWQSQYAGATDVAGADVVINGQPFTVIGVAPPGFRGLSVENRADVWVPFMTQPWTMAREYDVLGSRTSPSVEAVARLVPGVEPGQAETALVVAAGRLPEAARFDPVRPKVTPMRGWIPPGALLEAGAVLGFAGILTLVVLLICCANVAGLQLARSLGRGREIAVRLSLGAGRGRLVRLLITESVLLAIAAGALGLLISAWLARWLMVRFSGSDGPFDAMVVTPHAGTIIVTFLLALAAGLAFGLLPALRTVRPGLMPTMKGNHPGTAGGRRMRAVLAGAQVALSLVLLMAAGLFVNRMAEIGDVDIGFDAGRMAAFSVDLRANGYDAAGRELFFDELRRRLRSVPGVADVAAPTYVPLRTGVAVMAIAPPQGAEPAGSAADEEVPGGVRTANGRIGAEAVGVGAAFFNTLEVRAVRGRTLDERDIGADAGNIVISEPLARRFWGDRNPIGETLVVGTETLSVEDGDTVRTSPVATVVGTVAPLAIGSLGSNETLQIYVPEDRHFQLASQGVLIRIAGDPDAVLPRVREEVRRMDDALPLTDLGVLAGDLERQLGTQRTLTRLVGGFGVLALLLAVVGLYGAVAATVAARTREVGVRIALGARATDVTRMFVGNGVRIAGYGLAAGLLLALATGRLISTFVWGVRPFDPIVLALTALTLIGAAALASWLPARRAARIDPMTTLREE